MSIEIQQSSVKIPLVDSTALDLDAFIPIFHEWIRERRIEEELLIDVADYRHVPYGPGVVLIANEAHYALDGSGGTTGLLYSRRRDEVGDAKAAFREALLRAATAASLIENEASLGGILKFDPSRIEMRVMSRLTAPNTEETRLALEPVWSGLLSSVGFVGAELKPQSDPREAFGLALQSCAEAPDLARLLAAL
ncbi:MAG: hypothetical protein GY811_04315 [Myxococcales bacterium]|nr:hypothetical protein [Myxococcales bacterium]